MLFSPMTKHSPCTQWPPKQNNGLFKPLFFFFLYAYAWFTVLSSDFSTLVIFLRSQQRSLFTLQEMRQQIYKPRLRNWIQQKVNGERVFRGIIVRTGEGEEKGHGVGERKTRKVLLKFNVQFDTSPELIVRRWPYVCELHFPPSFQRLPCRTRRASNAGQPQAKVVQRSHQALCSQNTHVDAARSKHNPIKCTLYRSTPTILQSAYISCRSQSASGCGFTLYIMTVSDHNSVWLWDGFDRTNTNTHSCYHQNIHTYSHNAFLFLFRRNIHTPATWCVQE